MKKVKINTYVQMRTFGVASYDNVEEIFEIIDIELQKFGLELVLGNNLDSNHWIKIVKKKNFKTMCYSKLSNSEKYKMFTTCLNKLIKEKGWKL